MKEETKDGLGDKVENMIKFIVPKLAKSKANCTSCKKRKEWLNNINANFS